MFGIWGDRLDHEHGEMIERQMKIQNDEERENELAEAGLDAEELEFMDPWSRSELLKEAGLDPKEFDF